MQGQNPAAMVAHLKSRNEDRAEIIQEYNTKIAATQTTVMSELCAEVGDGVKG